MNFELKVQMPTTAPVVFNYTELKSQLETALADYSTRVYTEDMLSEAKEDSAKLNKLKTAIDNERKARKKEYMKPFETFEDQAKELCVLIDKANAGIKSQLDGFEEKRIAEKTEFIKGIFADIISNYDLSFISLEMIMNEKWLNKTTSEKAISSEIVDICEKATKDLAIIKRLPEYAFEATEVYKKTLDLDTALAEGEKIAAISDKKRQEALEKAKEQVANDSEPKYPLRFACEITVAQAKALKAFCEANGIELKQI